MVKKGSKEEKEENVVGDDVMSFFLAVAAAEQLDMCLVFGVWLRSQCATNKTKKHTHFYTHLKHTHQKKRSHYSTLCI